MRSRLAAAAASAVVVLAVQQAAWAQAVAPTASVPACHTFDGFGQPATLFAPGDPIIVRGEGFGLVTAIGVTFVQQSKTTQVAQAFSSELGVFTTDRGKPVIPNTATPGPASIHAFSSTRVATCAIQVLAASAAPRKKSSSPSFVTWWGVLLFAFGVFLAVVGIRRWRAARLESAVGGTAPGSDEGPPRIAATDLRVLPPLAEPETAPTSEAEIELPPLEEPDSPVLLEPPLVGEEPPPTAEPQTGALRSLAELAAPPLPPEPDRSPQSLAELAAPPPAAHDREDQTLAEFAGPPLPDEDEPDVIEALGPPAGPPPAPAEQPRARSKADEIMTAGVYWPMEELAETEDELLIQEPGARPVPNAPPEERTEGPRDSVEQPKDSAEAIVEEVDPSPAEIASFVVNAPPPAPPPSPVVDFEDAGDLADAMGLPMLRHDTAHPPILDANAPADAWNGRFASDQEDQDEPDENTPVVVEGDMSETVARLVEETKGGWKNQ